MPKTYSVSPVTNFDSQLLAQTDENEKYILLGRLVAGISHELNTPIGSVMAAASNLEELLLLSSRRQAEFFQVLNTATQARLSEFLALLQKDNALPPLSSREGRALKRKYAQALEEMEVEEGEEIAALLIESGFRSELEALQPLLTHPALKEILAFANLQGQIQKNLANLKASSEKAVRLIKSVKNFMQISQATTPTYLDLRELLEILLTLYHNHIKYGITLETSFGVLPEALTYPALLAQALAALLEHSIEAMERKGKLRIEAQNYLNAIEIRIEDTRPPIEAQFLDNFFEFSYLAQRYGAAQAHRITQGLSAIARLGGSLSYEQNEEYFSMILTLPLHAE
jgi:two-component system NtrC family sensor kinase